MAIEVYQEPDVEKNFCAALSQDGEIRILLERLEGRYLLLLHTEKSIRQLCWPACRYLNRGEEIPINFARIVQARKIVEITEDKSRLIGETQRNYLFSRPKDLIGLLNDNTAEVQLTNPENKVLESIHIGIVEYLAVQTEELKTEELWNLYRQIETKRISEKDLDETRSYLEIMVEEARTRHKKAF